MELIHVVETDLKLSKVCLGTMTFGSQVGEQESARMLDFALDRGVNFIDTANVYNAGLSEEITGRILGSRRTQIVLATKVRGKMGTGGRRVRRVESQGHLPRC